MFKILKFLSLIILLPLCYAFTLAFAKSVSHINFFESNMKWFSLGFIIYCIIHLAFSRPMFLYFTQHEITHGLWSFLFGGQVQEMHISAHRGGQVRVTKSNFLVILAPYFFPLFSIFFLILYKIIQETYAPHCAFLVGFFLSFHILLTIVSLRRGQPDLKQASVIFGLVFVYVMNVILIGTIVNSILPGRLWQNFLMDGIKQFIELWNMAGFPL